MTTKLPAQDALPFPPTPSASIAGRTMQESVYQRRVTPSRLPDDAPNILIVLIDDAGPGPAERPSAVRCTPRRSIAIVTEGIGYNRFHTTAMCSPTRASLLTGRNHHRVGNGQIAELANDWDGYSGHIPRSSALGGRGAASDYGYSTAAFGKWHNTPAEETTAAGPFDNWPTGSASSTSTASSPARPRSTSRTWCATRRSCCRRRRRRRATTSARTWRTTRSAGCAGTRRSSPTSRSSCTGRSGCLHGPHHIMKEWADKYAGQVRRRLGRLPRARLRRARRRRDGFPPTPS